METLRTSRACAARDAGPRITRGLASGLVVAVIASGCLVTPAETQPGSAGGGASSGAAGSPTPEAPPVYRDPVRLAVGDCFDPINETDSEAMLAARTRRCDEPHLAEVFGTGDHEAGPDDPWPGLDEMQSYAIEEVCDPAFTEYVGVDYELSTLDAEYVTPRAETWLAGDRLILCYVVASPSAPFVESVRDSSQ